MLIPEESQNRFSYFQPLTSDPYLKNVAPRGRLFASPCAHCPPKFHTTGGERKRAIGGFGLRVGLRAPAFDS
jgi:hypothetical protein